MEDILLKARAVLSSTPGRWLILANQLPADLLESPPVPGEWSALSCPRHLLAAEQHLYPPRVRAFLESRNFDPFDPNAQGPDGEESGDSEAARSLTPHKLAEEFAGLRAESLALLETLSPADLTLTAIHPEFGRVYLGDMLHTWAAHDLMHTRQAEQALMQPFVLGCGPWQKFFSGHVIPGAGDEF